MANPNFGTLVSESGAGFTWCGNSQSHRLTPWSNDPISDPPGCAIYIRDDDLGVCWSPTPAPISELDAYRARTGQGYTIFEHNSHAIEQELLIFVPVDAAGGQPCAVQRLRLRNMSSHRRKLTVTAYTTLVLGQRSGGNADARRDQVGFAKPQPFCAQRLRAGILRPLHLCHVESGALSFTATARCSSAATVPCAILRR
jgi:cellobiose phosphorylase